MPDPVARLLAFVDRSTRDLDLLSARFARELAAVLRDAERRLRPLLARAQSGDRTAVLQAAAANRVRQDLRTVLQQAGYDSLARAATTAPLDEIANRVLQGRRLGGVQTELSLDMDVRLQAFKTLHYAELLDAGDALSVQLSRALTRSLFGTQSIRDIVNTLGDVVDDSDNRIRTLYDTAISIYGREVEAIQAGDEPETTFLYVGPVDDKTRDFCLDHVGRVYTRSEIDDLDNGQIDNVFLTGGGYNCRHVWHEISRFSELYPLKGTSKRVPEVMDRVRDVRQAA